MMRNPGERRRTAHSESAAGAAAAAPGMRNQLLLVGAASEMRAKSGDSGAYSAAYPKRWEATIGLLGSAVVAVVTLCRLSQECPQEFGQLVAGQFARMQNGNAAAAAATVDRV